MDDPNPMPLEPDPIVACRESTADNRADCLVRYVFHDLKLVAFIQRRFRVDEHIALDLAQQTMLLVFVGAATYEPKGSPAAWVYKIANNVVLSYMRKGSNRAWHEYKGEPDPNLADHGPPPEAIASECDGPTFQFAGAAFEEKTLYEAIEEADLTPLEAALVHQRVHGRSHRDLGEMLGVNEQAIRRQLDALYERVESALRRRL
jgi:RNA polymerase sigma factor (sigma-70 family)